MIKIKINIGICFLGWHLPESEIYWNEKKEKMVSKCKKCGKSIWLDKEDRWREEVMVDNELT